MKLALLTMTEEALEEVQKRAAASSAGKFNATAADRARLLVELDAQRTFNADMVAFARFAREWRRIPPMVRAGMADGVVSRELRGEAEAHYPLMRHEVDGLEAILPRRAKVHEGFRLAHGAVRQLFMMLAKMADDECEALGIDVDVKPHPFERVSAEPESEEGV